MNHKNNNTYKKYKNNWEGCSPISSQKIEIEKFQDNIVLNYNNSKFKFDTVPFTSSSNNELIGLHNIKGKRIGFFKKDYSFGIVNLKDQEYKIIKKNNDYVIINNQVNKIIREDKKEGFLSSMSFHEDNIKFEIATLLKENNIKFLLEYTYKNCRFDIAIFKEYKLIGIIEIKKLTHKYETLYYSNRKLTTEDIGKFYMTKQIIKYLNISQVPVFVCRGYQNKNKALEFAKQLTK